MAKVKDQTLDEAVEETIAETKAEPQVKVVEGVTYITLS